MKRALHMAACFAAYARLFMSLLRKWSVFPIQANDIGPKIPCYYSYSILTGIILNISVKFY